MIYEPIEANTVSFEENLALLSDSDMCVYIT